MARKWEPRSSELKAKVALEALREESTLQELVENIRFTQSDTSVEKAGCREYAESV